MRYRSGSAALSTWAAVTHETSCSADWPPKITRRLIRSSATPMTVVGASHETLARSRRAIHGERGRGGNGRPCGRPRRGRSTRASFDSRTIRPGQLFVPIVADRDGHDFIATALAAGAGAYLTARPPDAPGGTAIVVDDTSRALLDLARWGRARLPGPVVGITGSVGKTTVKDLAAAVLRTRWRTAANERSFNNDQGLPVTILGAPDDVEVLVLEMGMRGLGEIARLCAVARPTIGVVTTVAEAHSERRRRDRGRRAGQGRARRGAAGGRHRHPQRRPTARPGAALPHRRRRC